MLPDGTGLTHVTDYTGNEDMPGITTDGTTLAYIHDATLTVSDADGENAASLGLFGASPTWSPDASRLAWSENAGLHLTNGVFDDFLLPFSNDNTRRDLTWSPDGTKVLFAYDAPGERYRLASIRADGRGSLVWLTPDTVDSYDPAWSPDGTEIAFIRG